ncbi:MAG: hypothetical protein Q8R47_02095 [Nanoarchaeota archaeon]|nr:hypothetical protein [Nanoarchaeota archaeon]
MFRFFNETKPGRRKNDITSLIETAMTKAEALLTKDLQKGLQYFRLAEQHYHQLNPETPGYLEIEYRLGCLWVNYFQKQAGLETQTKIFINNRLYQS